MYLQFSDWFETKRYSVWCHIDRKTVNTIWFWFDLIRFRKDLIFTCRWMVCFRPTGVSREHPWNPPLHHSTIVLRNLRGALNWTPMMPRDSQYEFVSTKFLFIHRNDLASLNVLFWSVTGKATFIFCLLSNIVAWIVCLPLYLFTHTLKNYIKFSLIHWRITSHFHCLLQCCGWFVSPNEILFAFKQLEKCNYMIQIWFNFAKFRIDFSACKFD